MSTRRGRISMTAGAGVLAAIAVWALARPSASSATALLVSAGLALLTAGLVARAHRRAAALLESELEEMRGDQLEWFGAGLRGPRAFTLELDRELLRADRSGQPLSLIVFGIDDERWPTPPEGSRQLLLAGTIARVVRQVDMVYRLGHGEFALVLPDTRARGGMLVAGRIEGALHAQHVPVPGAVCAGIAEAGPGIDRRTLFRHAYTAMLAAGEDSAHWALAYSAGQERGATSHAASDVGF